MLKKRQEQAKQKVSIKVSAPCMVKSFSLRKKWPAVYDQGLIGSCTANAFCADYKFLQKDKTFEPSRMYVYYKERSIECPEGGYITDSGASVSDARMWAHQHGVCSESAWPYLEDKVNESPPPECDEEAKNHRIGDSFNISTDALNTTKSCIVSGKPVLYAFGVYASFMTIDSKGIAPIPNPINYEDYNDPQDPFYGGHEVCIVGFDDSKKHLEVVNSWGDQWGDKGFFYVPYDFFKNKRLTYDLDVMYPGF
jgi:C1A family cysteine protease